MSEKPTRVQEVGPKLVRWREEASHHKAYDLARTLAAEVDARDAAITKLLGEIKAWIGTECRCESCQAFQQLYSRACAIAGRTE